MTLIQYGVLLLGLDNLDNLDNNENRRISLKVNREGRIYIYFKIHS